MKLTHLPRLLIVDDDAEFIDELLDIFPEGYQLEIPRGTGAELIKNMRAIAPVFRPHVAVIDLDLYRQGGNNTAGMDLLRELKSAHCIMYSNYLTPPKIREAMIEKGAYCCVGKPEGPTALFDNIKKAAYEKCVSCRETDLTLPGKMEEAYLDNLLLDTFSLSVPLEYNLIQEVICGCFPNADEITLTKIDESAITPTPVSRRRSLVMMVHTDRLQPLVIKVTKSEKILREYKCYKDHIEHNLRGHFHSEIIDEPFVFWDLGALVYNFLGDDREKQLTTFTRYYQKTREVDAIIEPLNFFFANVWYDLYKKAGEPHRKPLYDLYQESFNLDRNIDAYLSSPRMTNTVIPHSNLALPNPVIWLKDHKSGSVVTSAQQAVTHGDLHADNLITDGEHDWALDYERAGDGHRLRDFIKLENDLLSRVIHNDEIDDELFFHLLLLIYTPGLPEEMFTPQEDDRSGARLSQIQRKLWSSISSHTALQKAVGVIQGIRTLASELTDFRTYKEYYWGLLLDAVFIACLDPAEKEEQKRQVWRALIAGGLLCERLHNFDGDWIKTDWLPKVNNRRSVPMRGDLKKGPMN